MTRSQGPLAGKNLLDELEIKRRENLHISNWTAVLVKKLFLPGPIIKILGRSIH
jgi:hypothetical protein